MMRLSTLLPGTEKAAYWMWPLTGFLLLWLSFLPGPFIAFDLFGPKLGVLLSLGHSGLPLTCPMDRYYCLPLKCEHSTHCLHLTVSTWGFEPVSKATQSPLPPTALTIMLAFPTGHRALQILPVNLDEGRSKTFSASCLPTGKPSGNPNNKAWPSKSSLFTHVAWLRTFSHVIRYLIMLKMQLYDCLSELRPPEKWD